MEKLIDSKNLYIPAIRDLVVAMIQQAVDRAICGDPLEILWLGSDEAKFYYDALDIDMNTALVNFLKTYLIVRRWEQRMGKPRRIFYESLKGEKNRVVRQQIAEEKKNAILAKRM